MSDSTNKKIPLEPGVTYTVPIKNGVLEIDVSPDPEYPGVDIEYISNNETILADDQLRTRPRVLFECADGQLRALVWGNPNMEDYSHQINFDCVDDNMHGIKEGDIVSTKSGEIFIAGKMITGENGHIMLANINGSAAYDFEQINPQAQRSRKQYELQKKFREYGLDLIWHQFVPEDTDHVFFYGDDICSIYSTHGGIFRDDARGRVVLVANGDVDGELYKDGKHFDSFKDRGNNGYRHDVDRYLKTTADVETALQNWDEKINEGYALELTDNNWLEFFFDVVHDEKGSKQTGSAIGSPNVDGDVMESVVAESDNIFAEMENPYFFIRSCREALGMETQTFAVDIDWDIDEDDEDVDLPRMVPLPYEVATSDDDDAIPDYLSDKFGFCLRGYDLEDM